MSVIGSPKSLSRAARYCKDVSPILWNYRVPEQELRDGALEVYVAIAKNMARADKQAAIRMLKHALSITSGLLSVRQQVVAGLESLGVDIGARAAKAGFITHWHLIGPFPQPSGAGWKESLDEVCVDEPNVDLSGSYQVGDCEALEWVRYVSEQGMIDVEKLFDPHTGVSVYAYAEVVLSKEQELLLKIGSDDSFKCWFNGEEAGRYEGDRKWAADQDILEVKGKKGVNTVLLKISQAGAEWAFSASFTDTDNNPINCRQ
jgi:hypothetical protein